MREAVELVLVMVIVGSELMLEVEEEDGVVVVGRAAETIVAMGGIVYVCMCVA